MPIVLFVCQSVVRELKSNKERLPWSLIFMVTLFYSVYFEYYLPKVNPRYTADFVDVLLYFMGAVFFCIMEISGHSATWKKPSHL